MQGMARTFKKRRYASLFKIRLTETLYEKGNPAMNESYEEQKASSGSLATIVFIITGLYLFIANLGFSSLISLKALGFFVVGMFVAAIVIGLPAYLLQRATGKVLMKTVTDPYSEITIKKIKFIGIILLLIQVVITIFITNLVFQWLML